VNEPKQQTVNITPEQVQKACASAIKLLQDDTKVSIPPSLALSGDLTIIMGILNALAQGQAVLGNPPVPLEAPKPKGGEESAGSAIAED
jgi:hypothetical protein